MRSVLQVDGRHAHQYVVQCRRGRMDERMLADTKTRE